MLEIISHSDFQILHDAAAFIFTLTNQIQHSYDDCLCCQSMLKDPHHRSHSQRQQKEIFQEI